MIPNQIKIQFQSRILQTGTFAKTFLYPSLVSVLVVVTVLSIILLFHSSQLRSGVGLQECRIFPPFDLQEEFDHSASSVAFWHERKGKKKVLINRNWQAGTLDPLLLWIVNWEPTTWAMLAVPLLYSHIHYWIQIRVNPSFSAGST